MYLTPRFLVYSCFIFLSIFACIDDLFGQNGGKIAGTVKDEAGSTLPGVQVFIESTTRGTVTDIDGFYNIINVPAGKYTLIFKYVGFAEVKVSDVQIIIDRTTEINVKMKEATIEGEEVTIVAERPIVQKDRTTTTAFVSQEEIESLPVNSVSEVIDLQAGVVDGHFRGGATNEVTYIVNGVPINNPYTNSASFEVEQNMIANLEVITGVFNAEYGQATSGVVNIETKGPPREWSANFLGFARAIASTREMDYLTRNAGPGTSLSVNDFSYERASFLETGQVPNRQEVNLNIGGPIVSDKLGFNASFRLVDDQGRFIGRDLFQPSDLSDGILTRPNDPESWIIESTGSGDFVSLSHGRRWSANTSISWFPNSKFKLDYNFFYQNADFTGFSHSRKYVPAGVPTDYTQNMTHILSGRYTINKNTFVNLSYSYQWDKYDRYLYDEPLSDQLVPRIYNQQTGAFTFLMGGNDLGVSDQLTQSHNFIASITSQVNRYHQVKAGVQLRQYDLSNDNFDLIDVTSADSRTGFDVEPARVGDWRRRILNVRPYEFSAYIQDKIELNDMIINAGVRFDMFDPSYRVPIDWAQAGSPNIINAEGNEISNRTDASVKWQISPRVGVAFPISSEGVLRFSYGLFFQVPNYASIYSNPDFLVNQLSETTSYGNPDINPQSTSTFEIGLQQALSSDLGLELTIFTKEVRDLLATEILRDVESTNFSVRSVNRDYGTIRGFTLSLFQRSKGSLNWNIDYTLQFADGSFALSGDLFERVQAGLDETTTLARLDWDRRHVVNNRINWRPTNKWDITFINRLRSGRPYTTERGFVQSLVRNNANRPTIITTDLRLYYSLVKKKNQNVQLFLQAENLFDSLIQEAVYSDSGTATETPTLERNRNVDIQGLNTLEDWFWQQWMFGEPRMVALGISVRL